jgi:hypothetical protein
MYGFRVESMAAQHPASAYEAVNDIKAPANSVPSHNPSNIKVVINIRVLAFVVQVV